MFGIYVFRLFVMQQIEYTVALYLIEKVLSNFSLLRCFFILFLLSSPKGIFLLLLERAERRERTIDVREKP